MNSNTIASAKKVVGGIGEGNSKVSSYTYGLAPLVTCSVGRKLAKSKCNTVCKYCYAFSGSYVWPATVNAHKNRLTSITSALNDKSAMELWIESMVRLISRGKYKLMRWHDSGDMFDMKYYGMIVEVAKRTPEITHWIPTKQYHMIECMYGSAPDNITVRVSAPLVDQVLTKWTYSSAVMSLETLDKLKIDKGMVICPAIMRKLTGKASKAKCKNCTACWSKDVDVVIYPIH